MHDAKTRFSQLVKEAANGESFIIAKAGTPVTQVTAVDSSAVGRRLGFLQGQVTVPEDFDCLAEQEIAELFGG